MTNTLYVILSIVVGAAGSTQLAMLGAMGRERGPYEAAWVSILGTIAGLAAVVVIRSLRGNQPNLPAPLDSGWPFVAVLVACAVLLIISLRGLEPYFVLCGLFATAYLLTIGFAVPRIGAALFLVRRPEARCSALPSTITSARSELSHKRRRYFALLASALYCSASRWCESRLRCRNRSREPDALDPRPWTGHLAHAAVASCRGRGSRKWSFPGGAVEIRSGG